MRQQIREGGKQGEGKRQEERGGKMLRGTKVLRNRGREEKREKKRNEWR